MLKVLAKTTIFSNFGTGNKCPQKSARSSEFDRAKCPRAKSSAFGDPLEEGLDPRENRATAGRVPFLSLSNSQCHY